MLKFTLPMLPPSQNAMYTLQPIGNGRVRIGLKAEARRWKSDAKLFMPPWKLKANKLYALHVSLYCNWLTKKGAPKEKDVRNHSKLITDAIFERYGLSDKLVWDDQVTKVQSESERVEVELTEYKSEILIGGAYDNSLSDLNMIRLGKLS